MLFKCYLIFLKYKVESRERESGGGEYVSRLSYPWLWKHFNEKIIIELYDGPRSAPYFSTLVYISWKKTSVSLNEIATIAPFLFIIESVTSVMKQAASFVISKLL